jgi:hypothetical protein
MRTFGAFRSSRTSVSSSRRADVVAALAAVASSLVLSGCMKIYQDPELPDVEVEWFAADCEPGSADVVLKLTGVDDKAKMLDLVAPCTDGKATFVDVARERFLLDGILRGPGGEMLSHSGQDIDLRNGLDQTASLYFGSFENFFIAWTFDMGATCESLAADMVRVDFSSEISPEPFRFGTYCDDTPLFGSLPGGTFTASARAFSDNTIVAVSAPTEVTHPNDGGIADLGTLVLVPCADSCP